MQGVKCVFRSQRFIYTIDFAVRFAGNVLKKELFIIGVMGFQKLKINLHDRFCSTFRSLKSRFEPKQRSCVFSILAKNALKMHFNIALQNRT